MKKRWLGLLAPLAALPIALGSGAGAVTGWKTLGSGSATARGPEPAATVMLNATTRTDPIEVQITFSDGNFSGRSHVTWRITGIEEETGRMWTRTGFGNYFLSKTVTLSLPSWADYALVGAYANTLEGADAFQTVRIVMQARY